MRSPSLHGDDCELVIAVSGEETGESGLLFRVEVGLCHRIWVLPGGRNI